MIKMNLSGPIKLQAEQISTGAPKSLIKVRVSVTDDVHLWRTDLFAPFVTSLDDSLIHASFDVLRGLCQAWKDPEGFRKAAESENPQDHGVHVAVVTKDVEAWIEAAQNFGPKLEQEACRVTDDWWEGKPIKFDGESEPI